MFMFCIELLDINMKLEVEGEQMEMSEVDLSYLKKKKGGMQGWLMPLLWMGFGAIILLALQQFILEVKAAKEKEEIEQQYQQLSAKSLLCIQQNNLLLTQNQNLQETINKINSTVHSSSSNTQSELAQTKQQNSKLQKTIETLALQTKACEESAIIQRNGGLPELQRLRIQLEIKRENEKSVRQLANATFVPFDGQHAFDMDLLKLLKEFYTKKEIKSLADFGCGNGEYIESLRTVLNLDAIGYDSTLTQQRQFIKRLDLSQPVDLNRTFDYVQSFEVGEHIFQEYEDEFLANLARHAGKGIILSWAIVGQVGFMHVNNRDNSYIIPKLQNLGFKYNQDTTQYFRTGLHNYFTTSLMAFDKQ